VPRAPVPPPSTFRAPDGTSLRSHDVCGTIKKIYTLIRPPGPGVPMRRMRVGLSPFSAPPEPGPGRDRRPATVHHRPGHDQARPGWHRGRSCPAASSAAPSSPGRADRGCGWPCGARCGQPRRPTPSTPPATLTTREQNTLTPTQAQTVIAGAILRQLHAVITTGHAWDPDIAVRGTHPRRQPPIAA
jgi:hypothetical protein